MLSNRSAQLYHVTPSLDKHINPRLIRRRHAEVVYRVDTTLFSHARKLKLGLPCVLKHLIEKGHIFSGWEGRPKSFQFEFSRAFKTLNFLYFWKKKKIDKSLGRIPGYSLYFRVNLIRSRVRKTVNVTRIPVFRSAYDGVSGYSAGFCGPETSQVFGSSVSFNLIMRALERGLRLRKKVEAGSLCKHGAF